MAVALPILSFVCAALLTSFIPVKRIRMSVPNLAIVLWLIGCSIIHGINAIVWAGNVDAHIPVWCDIVSKFMLGANIALPGAFLCISRQLELVSSSRAISLNKKVTQNRTILDLLLCYMVPIIYMSLHLVAQDHRFDLVKDFGCSASIHPSTLALLIIWIPPLVLCSISFILCGISIHHACRTSSSQFELNLESRSTMTSSIFVRRLTICMVMSGALALIGIFSLFSVPTFQPWVSWDSVHAHLTEIDVVTSQGDIKIVQLAWWGATSVSILYLLLSLTLGEETRDAFKWVREQITKKRNLPKVVLPVYSKKVVPQMVSRSSSLSKPHTRPLTLELKSGWDDMLDSKSPKRKTSAKRDSKTSPSSCSTPTFGNRSVVEEDQMFMESTLSYLGSPTAKSLGIASSLQVPPAVVSPTPRSAFEIPPKPSSPPPIPASTANLTALKAAHIDTSKAIASVFDASWPVPPASPSPTPSIFPSRYSPSQARFTTSRSNSPTSSVEETFGYPLYPTITPPHLRTRPFEGSSISSLSEVAPASPTPSRGMKSVLKRPSIKNIRRSWSKERIGQGYVSSEVIHMTVVQETV